MTEHHMLIKDVLKRDLSRKIEEIIQVDQADEQSVYEEITDYVVTDRMRDSYATLLKAIAEGPAAPDERVGVWISGFFGSGKSSFAKNLGYVLANPTVLGQPAAELFKTQVQDARIAALVDSINARIPTEVVMFDIQKDRAQTGQGNLSISPFLYRVLLRRLGYAEDFDIAELEISLEAEGLLPDFIARFNARYAAADERNVWERRGRSGSQVWNRAGAILHELDPRTYPSPDSFARGLAQNRVEVSAQFLVQRSFELMERRRPSKALTFIIDEVGAYVAFSQDRLEDLRAVVEEFGKQSKNRAKARKIVGPTWVIVTAQERLDEVTSAMGDDKKVLLAKVQDRFQYRVDLSPADIREVATRRVLSKTEAGERQLEQLFAGHQGQLITATRIERTTRRTDFGAVEFTQFYPYLPHYIELSIDIVSGIRLQPGATRHIGGSNRTIISQVYQMLVNERTRFAERQVGTLVTLDSIYELIEAQVGSAKQKDISDIDERPKDDPLVRAWAGRVARVIALLEYVRDLPRTPVNIAALLVDEVGRPVPVSAVEQALAWLVKADFVRETDQGFKLQTAQEKNWTTERKSFLEPRPKERNEIKREMLGSIFAEAAFRTYIYRGLKNFRVGITVDGARVGDEGQVPLVLVVADDEADVPVKRDQTVTESRQKGQEHHIIWVFPLTPEIDDLIANLYASRQMIARYNALQAQNKINSEEATSLSGERAEEERLKRRLRDKLSEALVNGIGIFRGRTKDASELGRAPTEIFKRLFDLYVPDLYPKLELGARSLKGNEAEEVLKAANLNALPQVFYSNDNGLGLVVQEGQKYVLNPNAPIAKEVIDYLRAEHSYGNRVTGRNLEDHFRGIGYGWDLDILQLVLAVLLRAQRAYQEQGLKANQRLPITRVNMVCAEPMPGERALLDEFVQELEPAVLGQLVRVVFERMKLAGEAGSLLKIEEELRDAIEAAKRQWKARPRAEQLTLFPEERRAIAEQLTIYDVAQISDEAFWSEAEARVLEALQQYAERAANGQGYRRRLFAGDAARGFAFIDVCQRRYDVVLMNPPFGAASKGWKAPFEKAYPRTKNDLYAAFVERGLAWLHRGGMLGAITSRTGFFLTSFQKWREEILLKEARPTVVADLGYGVLDTAMVETAAYCLEVL
jgi:hypothetical protein